MLAEKIETKVGQFSNWVQDNLEIVSGTLTGGITGMIMTGDFVTTLIQAIIIAAATAGVGALVGGLVKMWLKKLSK